jgi:hypothetical protein
MEGCPGATFGVMPLKPWDNWRLSYDRMECHCLKAFNDNQVGWSSARCTRHFLQALKEEGYTDKLVVNLFGS